MSHQIYMDPDKYEGLGYSAVLFYKDDTVSISLGQTGSYDPRLGRHPSWKLATISLEGSVSHFTVITTEKEYAEIRQSPKDELGKLAMKIFLSALDATHFQQVLKSQYEYGYRCGKEDLQLAMCNLLGIRA